MAGALEEFTKAIMFALRCPSSAQTASPQVEIDSYASFAKAKTVYISYIDGCAAPRALIAIPCVCSLVTTVVHHSSDWDGPCAVSDSICDAPVSCTSPRPGHLIGRSGTDQECMPSVSQDFHPNLGISQKNQEIPENLGNFLKISGIS